MAIKLAEPTDIRRQRGVPAQTASAFYCVPRFLAEPGYLSDVDQFDRPLLGDIAGLRGAHRQCHTGTDTVSLARLGASMTGLDFSGPAVEAAASPAAATGADATFVQADVYTAADVLPANAFDLVYTGIGALCRLPGIRRWARVVAALLRPCGRLFIRDGHPMLLTIEERDDDLLAVKYPYFEQPEPVTWTEGGTAARRPARPARAQLHDPGGKATSVRVTRLARSMVPGRPRR